MRQCLPHVFSSTSSSTSITRSTTPLPKFPIPCPVPDLPSSDQRQSPSRSTCPSNHHEWRLVRVTKRGWCRSWGIPRVRALETHRVEVLVVKWVLRTSSVYLKLNFLRLGPPVRQGEGEIQIVGCWFPRDECGQAFDIFEGISWTKI